MNLRANKRVPARLRKDEALRLAEQFMMAGREADRKAYEEKQAEAKARLAELERIGAHDRIRWLDKVQRSLEAYYPDADARVGQLLSQCKTLIGSMARSVCQPPYHEYEQSDRSRLELLVRKIKDAKLSEKQRGRASGPRKEVTAAQFISYRKAYEDKYRKLRGWKTAARAEFGVSLQTLNKRLNSK